MRLFIPDSVIPLAFLVVLGFSIMSIPQPSKAVDITMSQITVRDLFMGLALCGHISATGGVHSPSQHAEYAVQCADEMMRRRGR